MWWAYHLWRQYHFWRLNADFVWFQRFNHQKEDSPTQGKEKLTKKKFYDFRKQFHYNRLNYKYRFKLFSYWISAQKVSWFQCKNQIICQFFICWILWAIKNQPHWKCDWTSDANWKFRQRQINKHIKQANFQWANQEILSKRK